MDAATVTTLVGAGVAGLAGVGGAVKLLWTWQTGLVDKMQSDSVATRHEFTAAIKDSRDEFLNGMQAMESKREASEQRCNDALLNFATTITSLTSVLRERGLPVPTTSGVKP